MATVQKWRIHCITENDDFFTWAEEEPTVCPNNNTHTIDSNQTIVEEEAVTVQAEISNLATTEDPAGSTKRVLRAAPQPSSPGFYMCSRDFKLKCGTLGSDSFEDLKVDPTTIKRISWNELSLIGVYKGNESDGYTPCTSQGDADNNAILSIWDYQARVQAGANKGQLCEYEIRGGGLYPANPLSGSGADLWKHQMYVIMAPDIPSPYGCVNFFDGYLKPVESVGLSCENSVASKMDPSVVPYASILRIYMYYPAGAKDEHVLRLCTYRQVDTLGGTSSSSSSCGSSSSSCSFSSSS